MKAMKPVFSSSVSRREFLGQAALSVSALALAAGCADSGGRAGRKIPVGVQLYSVREQCKQDLPGTLAAIAQIGYHGVEFAGYHGRIVQELR